MTFSEWYIKRLPPHIAAHYVKHNMIEGTVYYDNMEAAYKAGMEQAAVIADEYLVLVGDAIREEMK